MACHQFGLLRRIDVLALARPGGRSCSTRPTPPTMSGRTCRHRCSGRSSTRTSSCGRRRADGLAEELGLGRRINTVMQACFFALAGVMPIDDALRYIKQSIVKSYGKRGDTVVQQNIAAVERAVIGLHHVDVGVASTSTSVASAGETAGASVCHTARSRPSCCPTTAIACRCSAMPADGAFPTNTAALREAGAGVVPADLGLVDLHRLRQCAIVCPHAAIRMKVYEASELDGAPEGFKSKSFRFARPARPLPHGAARAGRLAPAAECASRPAPRPRQGRPCAEVADARAGERAPRTANGPQHGTSSGRCPSSRVMP